MTHHTPHHVIVFDLGKVLLDFDYQISVDRIAKRDGLDPVRLRSILGATPLLLAYEEGLMTTEEFFRSFVSETGYRESLAQFAADFADIFNPIDPMIDLHRRCREAGHQTFIFSNTNELAIQYIRRQFPFFHTFTGHILSYECRAMKPEPGMYDALERQTGLNKDVFVYLDDRPENIETARTRGWNVCVHSEPAASIQFVEQYLGR